MKKIYLFKLIVVVFLLSFGVTVSAQQMNGVGGTLEGETVVDVSSIAGGNIIATGNSIYAAEIANRGVLGDLHGYLYEKLWSPEPGRKIVAINDKKKEVRDKDGKLTEIKETDNLVVILDNGDVYVIYINHADISNTLFFPSVSSVTYYNDVKVGGGSQAYEKILGDALYALSSQYLYVSKDSTNWNVDSAGLNGAHINDVALDTIQNAYVSTNQGLFVQDTAMHAFKKIASYAGTQNLSSIFIDRRNRIFIGVQGGGIYVSNDSAASWQIDTAGAGNIQPKKFMDDPFGNLFLTTGPHIYRSLGGDHPWQLVDSSIYNSLNTIPDIRSISTLDSAIFAGTSFGVFLSVDSGKTWIQNNAGIKAENIYGFAKTKTQSFLSTNLGIFRNTNGDTTWTKVYPSNAYLGGLKLYDDNSGNIYTIDNSLSNNFLLGGYLLKSSDGGDTWAPDTLGLSGVGGSVFFIDEKGTQHVGNSFYSGSKPSELWQRKKNATWAIDTIGFPVLSYSFVNSITSDGAGYLYATGSFGNEKLLRRSITGTQWVIDTAGIPAAVSYFNKIAGNKGDVVGTANGAIFHRGNGTWHSIPLPAQATFPVVSTAAIDTSGYIFVALSAATGSGIYFTNDLGAHWKYAGLDSAKVNSLVCYGDTTYVLTNNMGAFALTHNSALPVTLSSIRAYQLGKGIQVEWSGYNEINMSGYDVERSANGNSFSKIGNVTAKSNGTENSYTFFDGAPFSGDNFYRVKAISKDGTSQYSGIVKVNVGSSVSDMLIYPNPASNKTINVQLNNIDAGKYSLVVYNAAGQKLYATIITHPGGNAGIAINMRSMAKGAYWVVLKNGNQTFRKTIIVQ